MGVEGVVVVGTVLLLLVARFITAVVVPGVLGGLLVAALGIVAMQAFASLVVQREGE